MDERVEKKVTPPRITGSGIVNVIQRVKIQLDDSTVYILHHHDKVQPQVNNSIYNYVTFLASEKMAY